MLSIAKLEANKKNAQRSTGPKTPEGRRRSSGNAVKHGLSAVSHLVIPGVESPEELEAHIQFVLEDLKPVGQAELSLAVRWATLDWRMRRVMAAETGMIWQDQLQAPGEYDHHIFELCEAKRDPLDGFSFCESKHLSKYIGAALSMLECLSSLRDADPVSSDAMEGIFYGLEKMTRGEITRFLARDIPGAPEYVTDSDQWTGRLARAILKKASKELRLKVEALSRDIDSYLRKVQERLAAVTEKVDKGFLAYRLGKMVSRDAHGDVIARHESHLQRTADQVLNQLHTLQDRRLKRAGGQT
jgi:hypothetical protein